MSSKLALVVLALMLGFVGCRRERWSGWAYPDKTDLTASVVVGDFETLNACRVASTERLRMLNSLETGDYECGLNCRPSETGSGLYICAETYDSGDARSQ